MEFLRFKASLLPYKGYSEKTMAKQAQNLEAQFRALALPWVEPPEEFNPVKFYYDTIKRHREIHKDEEEDS